MNIIFRFQGIEFEWDEQKAIANIEKHGVRFEEAAEIFFDPFVRSGDASGNSDEAREFVLGYTTAARLLLVVYVEREPRLRIISARQATRGERILYEDI